MSGGDAIMRRGPDSDLGPVPMRIYEYLRTQGDVRVDALCRALGIDETTAAPALDRLSALGLLAHGASPDTVAAISTQEAEATELDRLRKSLTGIAADVEGVRARLDGLRAVRDGLPGRFADDQSIVLLGERSAVERRLEEAAHTCAFEVLTAQPGGPRPERVLAGAFSRDLAMLKRGVSMRTIYQHSARFSETTQTHAERMSAAGAEIRTLDELFPRLMIFDRRIAFIPHGSDGGGAVLIALPDIVAFLVETFEMSWRSALPLTSAYKSRTNSTVVSDIQRSITELMLTEDKDVAIARRLGISERTCRSHISKIMQHFGARNRTHLGYLLAQEAAQKAPDRDRNGS
jgi:DNA-binding CsgD family transcriptional regulator